MGRRVAFQCDILMMVLHESYPGFRLSYLMVVNFTTLTSLLIYNLKWLVTNMHTHFHC